MISEKMRKRNFVLPVLCILLLCLLGLSGCAMAEPLELQYELLEQEGNTIAFSTWPLEVPDGWTERLGYEECLERMEGLDFSSLSVPEEMSLESPEGREYTIHYDGEGRVLDYYVLQYRFCGEEGREVTVNLRPGAMAMNDKVQFYREMLQPIGHEREEPQPNSRIGKLELAAFRCTTRVWNEQGESVEADVYSASFMLGETGVCVSSVGLSREGYEAVLMDALRIGRKLL